MGGAQVEDLGRQFLHRGVRHRLEMCLDVGLPTNPNDLLTEACTFAVVAVIAEQEVGLEQHPVLVLFRSPVVDELKHR